mgnify:CR=1 FL=1|jgi:hypothetical protein
MIVYGRVFSPIKSKRLQWSRGGVKIEQLSNRIGEDVFQISFDGVSCTSASAEVALLNLCAELDFSLDTFLPKSEWED